ncbi:MAG: hypothetical protein CMJ78_18615 [Planctomycetaceae bacterium]|nr:hypothetical protein [Planctomycetaceae bacterium]
MSTDETHRSQQARLSDQVQELHDALLSLESQSELLQIPELREREWFGLLTEKLIPQLSSEAFLVVAVVGGTNIGKSVIFNHLAGSRSSATSPLASGTKHPMCLVPPGFTESFDLSAIFPGFELTEWADADQPLQEIDEDRLFWRTSETPAKTLLVLDTPDIDSDTKVNWARADKIRLCADVLIAVLTQQKYNDAAIKEFFRKAASEDKAVIVVFNQCLLPDDEVYWPVWLETFCEETGVDPELLYIAPSDRRAAEDNQLPFFERTWPFLNDTHTLDHTPRNLNTDLANLKFAEIRMRTLKGSLKTISEPGQGVAGYLGEIRTRSDEFESTARLLATHNLAEIKNWPPAPNAVMIAAIREWWASQREGWQASVHNFYNFIGSGISKTYEFAKTKLQGESLSPIEEYRNQEWEAILGAIENVYEKLEWFRDSGNRLLQPRLENLLSGTSRTDLIQKLQSAHAQCDLELELEDLVAEELKRFRDESPQFYSFFKKLDSVAAAARPATSIVLFVSGFGPVGDVAGNLVANSMLQSVVSVTGDVAGGTIAAAVGETAISSTASSGAGFLEAKFRRLHASFTASRATWLGRLLKENLLGELPEQLNQAATVSQVAEYSKVQDLTAQLRSFANSK